MPSARKKRDGDMRLRPAVKKIGLRKPGVRRAKSKILIPCLWKLSSMLLNRSGGSRRLLVQELPLVLGPVRFLGCLDSEKAGYGISTYPR
jgi:hypothetical protein